MLDLDLIRNLVNSSSDNATVDIVLVVQKLGDQWGWSIEERQAVGMAICDLRQAFIQQNIELIEMTLRGIFK